MTVKISEQDKKDIISKYNIGDRTIASIAREYNKCPVWMRRFLIRNGITTDYSTKTRLCRKYHLNHNYFDIIDTEEKAYFLGLLYADGSNDTDRSKIRISLQESDLEILEKFNSSIESNRPIKFINLNDDDSNHKNIYLLSISSRNMSDKLAEVGCFKNKMYTLKFPTANQVPEHLLQHWLRGMWDGDGTSSLFESKNKLKMSASLVGTLDICENVREKILDKIYIKSSLYNYRNSYSVALSSCRNVYNFYTWLYKDASIYLNRKFLKFKEQEKIIIDRLLSSRQLRVSFGDILC